MTDGEGRFRASNLPLGKYEVEAALPGFATGKRDQARDSYLKALTGMDVAAPQRRLVELKLTDAGGTPPKPEQPTR